MLLILLLCTRTSEPTYSVLLIVPTYMTLVDADADTVHINLVHLFDADAVTL